ncbi:hypothetical protein BDY21DRAFT_354303 [Lineolata rhizophorae]|uniref:ER membrane protein complex subunit 1 n=1 Tax=Lineolata rhizophorae TaxID=578093 RepID=A0A6A6NR08_9PEZI|nr:hypothetical protein BDY21DRAFT_354303 [Lineolata rhizophorae]
MRLLRTLLALAVFILPPVLAIFVDEAFKIDYHYALLGQPQPSTTFFHPPFAASKASLIYTLTNKLVLGAVNPKDGAIVWRQLLQSPTNDSETLLRAGENQDVVVSGIDGQVAAWSGADGKLAWQSRFGSAQVKDLEIIEFEDGKAEDGVRDVIVLFGGDMPVVRRLDGRSGATMWEFEDSSGDTPFQVTVSSSKIYYISLYSPLLGSSKLKVTSLNPLNGQRVDQYTLASDTDVSSADSILFAGANSASPILAWTDKARKNLKVNIIGNKNIISLGIENTSAEEIEKIVLHAPQKINSLPHFLVHYQTAGAHWAEVYHTDLARATISKAYSLPSLSGHGSFAVSNVDANVLFTRITNDEVTVVSSASHGILGRWGVQGFDSLQAVHAVSEVVMKSGSASAVRCAVLRSNGEWAQLRNGEQSWSRPEYLSGVVAMTWADISRGESLAHELDIEAHENVLEAYIHRVKRHIGDLKHFPAWIQGIPDRVLASFLGKQDSNAPGKLQQDTFGFHKLVVLATENGYLTALDAGSQGKIAWSSEIIKLPSSTKWANVTLEVTSDGNILVSESGAVRPVHVSTLTGQIIHEEAALETSGKLEQDGKAVIMYDIIDGELQGFLLGKPGSAPLWSFAPHAGERFTSVIARPMIDPVASIGKVLGDRRVLYKYLNPNLVLVTGVTDSTNTARIYLLDSASGNILYVAQHDDVDTSRPIPSTITENWLAYSFTTLASPLNPSRGYVLAVAELFESPLPNDRGPLGARENVSALHPASGGEPAPKPHVIAQAFHIPAELSHLSVTRTRQGITSRQLLAVVPDLHAVVAVPRSAIDARRPVGRDPSADEAAEGLVKYHPVLEFDPKWFLTHSREVFGVQRVSAAPALVESTSLLFAWGTVDLWGSRVAPSFSFDVLGAQFNKMQMAMTVAALGVAVFVVGPMVRRKQINMHWQM